MRWREDNLEIWYHGPFLDLEIDGPTFQSKGKTSRVDDRSLWSIEEEIMTRPGPML